MRIALTGAQGTGKTTIINILKTLWMFDGYKTNQNFQRTMSSHLSKFKINQHADIYSQTAISGYFAFEVITNENLLAERSIIDTFAYTRCNENMTDDAKRLVINMYWDALRLYDIIFYLEPFDVVEEDGVRNTDKEYINNVDRYIKGFLSQAEDDFKTKIVKINKDTTVEERIEIIMNELKEIV